MPTGYTADVQSGKITAFPDFALSCARAFGALIMMRDDPADAAIPEKFEAQVSYHDKALVEAEERLARLRRMAADEIAAAADAAFEATMSEWRARKAERDEQRSRYEAMLAKVRAWQPPTSEHQGLREFMEEQLRTSIDFDCSPRRDVEPRRPTASEWHADEISKAQWSADYHAKNRAEEIERTNGRNKWIADLRASLESAP